MTRQWREWQDQSFGWFISADNVLTPAMDAAQLHIWLAERGVSLPSLSGIPSCGRHGVFALYNRREVQKWLNESS
jgi:hypothetical protein